MDKFTEGIAFIMEGKTEKVFYKCLKALEKALELATQISVKKKTEVSVATKNQKLQRKTTFSERNNTKSSRKHAIPHHRLSRLNP